MTRAVINQFASLTNPTLPNLDADFIGVANTLVVPCTASGTNAVTLTPVASTVTVSGYTDKDQYTFDAPATSTGVMTMQVGVLGLLKLFKAGGTTQATAGDVVLVQFYQVAYQATLDTGAGGFVIVSAIALAAASAVAQAFPTLIVQDRRASGTAGQTITVNTFTDRTVQTVLLNTLVSGGGVSTPNITLPQGTFDMTVIIAFGGSGSQTIRGRLFNTTAGATQPDMTGNDIVSVNELSPSTTGGVMVLQDRFLLSNASYAAGAQVKFQSWSDSGTATGGAASNTAAGNAEPEVYLNAVFVKVA